MNKKQKILLTSGAILIALTMFSYGFVKYKSIKYFYGKNGFGIPANLIEHHSVFGNFYISLPETWGVADTPGQNKGEKNVILISESFYKQAYVKVYKIDTVNDISNLEGWDTNRLNSLKNYELISNKNLTSTKYSGLAYQYYDTRHISIFISPQKFECLDWLLLNKTGYVFSFCISEYDKWAEIENTFLQILNSLKFE